MSKESSNKRQAKEVEREQLVAVSVGARVELCGVGTLVVNTFQRRRFASQMKPIQDCHPERSEGSLAGQRSFAALRMTGGGRPQRCCLPHGNTGPSWLPFTPLEATSVPGSTTSSNASGSSFASLQPELPPQPHVATPLNCPCPARRAA